MISPRTRPLLRVSHIKADAAFSPASPFKASRFKPVRAGRILAAAVYLPLAAYMPDEAFNSWVAGYIIRRELSETPAFAEEDSQGKVPKAIIMQAFTLCRRDMLRVVCMTLANRFIM
jgi:hypothetical protein